MLTKSETLTGLENQLAAMDRDIALSLPSPDAPGRTRSTLAKKLDAAGGQAPSPFGISAADRRRLQAATKRESQLMRADLAQFLKTPVPPQLAQFRTETVTLRHLAPRPRPNVFAAHKAEIGRLLFPLDLQTTPFEADLTPPAVDGTPANTASAAIGELNLRDQNTGMGGAWGLLAAPTRSPVTGSLRFAFTPPFNAAVYATAQIDVAGTVYAVSHDHWYTSAAARCTLRLGCNLYQKYLDAGPSITIVDEHHTDSSAAYWLLDSFTPSASTTVEAGTPLIAQVWAALEVYARSDHALVDVDFFTGADRYIRVPRVTLTIVPI